MWAADPTYDNPNRSTYAEKTFLNVAGTQPNVTGTDNYLCYGTLYMANTVTGDKFFARLSGTGGTSSSSYAYATPATGFLAASSTSATNTYGSINANRDRPWGLYFTGATQVSVLKKDNNTSSNKWVTLNLYTVAADGTETLVEEKEESSPDKNNIKVLSCATTLSASAYYKLEITSGNTSNCAIYQVSFKQPDACSTEITTQPSGATLAIGDANPELSVVATNVASYAWKESSDGTSYDGASSLGSSASFTPSVNDAVQTKYYYCEVTSSCDGAEVVKSNIVTVNVVGAITYYTVTLNPAGGTIADATGWTLNAGNYEKEVAEGTVLTLPTFTKTDRTFKTWRKEGPADVASPVTVDGDLSLTAIWTATIEQVIYSWEGAEGGAIETGGTAAGNVDNLINQVSAGYYCLKIDGNNSYSGNLVTITLSGEEKIKTGDKIKYWGFYNKSSNANARPKMRDANGSNASIFDDPNNLPNLYSGGDPAERTFTVPASINTNAVQLTRSQTGSNTWISKLQIIRELQVEEGDLLTVTFDASGGSAIAPVVVASGQAVAQPTDPTWEHHRFDGWYNGETLYDWTANVTGDLTLTAHWTQLYTITYAAGDGTATGDAPTQVDKAEGETFTVAANTFEVVGKDFVKWNDGTNDYAPGATYTVGTANVVLTAQWKAAADKYTVIFKDGTTELGTRLFDVTTNPSDADIDKTKALNTFAAWQKEGVDIALDDAFWATVAKDAEITLTARWAKAFATSYDMEAYAVSDGATLETLLSNLDAAGYAYTNVNGIDNGHTHNYIYDGMKYKTNDGDLSFNVNAGKLVIVKTGNLPANALTMYINGVADPTVFVGANEAVETHVNNYFYSADEALYRLDIQASKGTCAIKAVTITDPFTVTFNANGGDDVASLNGTPFVTLPLPTNGTESFLGWFDGETRVGEAGDKYTPASNITLKAHWEAVSTDARLASITLSSDAGTLSPAFDPEVTNYTYTMPYGTAAVPTITGATSVSAKAQEPQIVSQASAWGETAVIRGVAESNDTKAYNITMLRAPKDGVEIIRATHTGANTANVTGTIGGTYDKNTQDGGKLGSNGHYLGIKLAEGSFLAGDVVKVVASTLNGGNTATLFSDKGENAIASPAIDEASKTATHVLTGSSEWIYLYRATADCNPTLGYIAVYRAMNPMLTAITFDGVAGVIDEANKKVTVELPFSSNVASMIVEPTIAWNAAAATNAIVVNDGSDWVIGDNTYVLTDKDGDQTTYTITLTQALPSADAALATLTYNGTNITLEADQYNYEVELPKGTVDVPTVTYTTNNAGATVVKTDAAVLPGATTIIVTAEDGTTQQNYTINFTVSTSDIITIFDGSTMSNIATSPSGAISWEIVGSTMGAGDKNISYNDVTYTRALSCGNSSATKHLKIVVADNNKAQFEIIGMSNSSSDTRHAWLTNSTDKGEFANAIASLTSNGYNPAKFTTDWLEEGTYYLHSDNTVAILLIRVKAEPVPAKCEAPTISGLADVAVCDLSSALLDGTATVSDGGTVTYKWYAEGDAETVLATTATYAPTTVGNYYVVATNSLADYRDNSTTSSVVVVRIKTAPVITTEVLDQHAEAGNNVTLSVVATDAESYQWYTCDDAAGTNPVEVVGATNASLEVAVTSGMSQYYKVIISNTCGSAESIGKVEEWTELPQANVTGSRTWDWAAESMGTIETVSGSTEYLMANVSSQVPNTEAFRSDMLYITANYANRGASDKFFQGWQIRFYTEVPGRVSLNCCAIHGTMSITINGTVIDDAKGSDMGTATTPFFVPAGWVTIVFDNQSSGNEGEAARVQKIVFNANPDYTRDVTVGSLGTICLPSNVPAGHAFGATFYELEGKEPQYGKIVFDEVTGELAAGVPYLFQAQGDALYCFYGTTSVSSPDNTGAMKGTFVDLELDELSNIYYFADRALWSCVDLTELSVPANRAYVNMAEVTTITGPAPVGVRRITLGVNGQNTATGVDQVQGDNVPTKMIINGQLFILRGEKMYDAQGKLVK